LFAPLLPEDLAGLWLYLCHLLAAYFTIKIFELFNVNPVYTFLAVSLRQIGTFTGDCTQLFAHIDFLADLSLFLPALSARRILHIS
jgi:hypothetical protein